MTFIICLLIMFGIGILGYLITDSMFFAGVSITSFILTIFSVLTLLKKSWTTLGVFFD